MHQNRGEGANRAEAYSQVKWFFLVFTIFTKLQFHVCSAAHRSVGNPNVCGHHHQHHHLYQLWDSASSIPVVATFYTHQCDDTSSTGSSYHVNTDVGSPISTEFSNDIVLDVSTPGMATTRIVLDQYLETTPKDDE